MSKRWRNRPYFNQREFEGREESTCHPLFELLTDESIDGLIAALSLTPYTLSTPKFQLVHMLKVSSATEHNASG